MNTIGNRRASLARVGDPGGSGGGTFIAIIVLILGVSVLLSLNTPDHRSAGARAKDSVRSFKPAWWL